MGHVVCLIEAILAFAKLINFDTTLYNVDITLYVNLYIFSVIITSRRLRYIAPTQADQPLTVEGLKTVLATLKKDIKEMDDKLLVLKSNLKKQRSKDPQLQSGKVGKGTNKKSMKKRKDIDDSDDDDDEDDSDDSDWWPMMTDIHVASPVF